MKSNSILFLVLVVVCAVGLGCLSYFGIGSNNLLGVGNIKQGLDLKGGVSILYKPDKEAPTKEEMNSAESLLRDRLDRQNYTEAEVSIQDEIRLRVDIPDVADAQTAVAEIGQTAQLYFVDEGNNVLLTGDLIKNAYKTVDESSRPAVALEFTSEGATLFEQATTANVGKTLSILLDEAVLSAPRVNGAISGGNAIITGNFTVKEADELSALIRAGALPFNLEIESLNNVGAKLGANSLEASIFAGLVGFCLVLVFMVVIYRMSGIASNIALIIFLALELIVLSMFRLTLTLPGIAGIVLSIGMAVDANVIIFERIKEELRVGRTVKSAIDAGFKRAFPAILDGNITTLIAAAVLFWLGTGPIKGFAQTLSIGIAISMFSAIVITRFVIKNMVAAGIVNPKLYGVK